MNVKLSKAMVKRIKKRADDLGVSSQSVMRRCLKMDLGMVEVWGISEVSTKLGACVSTPIDVPDGIKADEVRARIQLALDVTAEACKPVKFPKPSEPYEVV